MESIGPGPFRRGLFRPAGLFIGPVVSQRDWMARYGGHVTAGMAFRSGIGAAGYASGRLCIQQCGYWRLPQRSHRTMSDNWIGQLATQIKQTDREAAQDYARAQHYAGVAAERGRGFFIDVVNCLQQDVDALRRELQGDVTSAEMTLERVRPAEVRITRARFPWVDARLTHSDDAITLDYAKGAGTAGDPQQDRVTRSFAFRVGQDEKLRVEEAFAAQPKSCETAEEFARAVMEILFSVPGQGNSLNGGADAVSVQAA
jgi:hypothetical protein